MRVLVLSDLHVEHAPFAAPAGDYDAVILAGDIHNGVTALQWARQTFPRHPIIQIAGNHEFYDQVLQPCRAAMQSMAKSLGIHFLDDARLVLGGIEFLGTTLWTDFRFFDSPGRALRLDAAQAMQASRGLMADYFAIKIAADDDDDAVASHGTSLRPSLPPSRNPLLNPSLRTFEPADSLALHQRSRHWLQQALAEPAVGTRVVISHHLPSGRSVSSRFASSVTNAAFVSDLDNLVAQSNWWIHGHTHSSHRYPIGNATVLSNPRGYPKRGVSGGFENPAFQPDLIIDLASW